MFKTGGSAYLFVNGDEVLLFVYRYCSASAFGVAEFVVTIGLFVSVTRLDCLQSVQFFQLWFWLWRPKNVVFFTLSMLLSFRIYCRRMFFKFIFVVSSFLLNVFLHLCLDWGFCSWCYSYFLYLYAVWIGNLSLTCVMLLLFPIVYWTQV